MKQKKEITISAIALVVIILDQLTKLWVDASMKVGQSIPLINNLFHLTYTQNTGAAFGILKNHQLIFILFALFVISLILYYWKRIPQKNIIIVPIGLILGGTIGNLIDRLRFQYVIDFLDFRIWPTFNIADSAITIGAILLIFYVWKKK